MPTFGDLLLARVGDRHTGLRSDDGEWSWDAVVGAAGRRAAAVRALVPDPLRHVGVMLDNVPENLFWIFGAALGGATVVGINTTRRGAELGADIRHTDCRLLVTDRAHLPLLDGVDTGVPPERIVVVDAPSYADLLESVPDVEPVRGQAEDRLLLLFTSGSTGAPKAVICTSGRLARIAAVSATLFGIDRDEVCYQSMPMFHGNAIMANIAPATAAGATIVLRPKFSASGFLPDVRRHRATYFNYVGRSLAYILATPPSVQDADNRLRLGFGTEATAQDREAFTARFGCRLMESYGSSEGVISTRVDDTTPPDSIGRPAAQPGTDVAVVDPRTAAECPPAEFDPTGRILNAAHAIGEIVNRAGPTGFEGYYNNEAATAERVRGGWYWSGDLGYRDGDGYLYFAGRGADWLRVDSENFAAAPIERILQRHPAVALAAVYAVPDPRTGDRVMAAVELVEPGALEPAELDAFLAAQPDLGTKWAPQLVRIVAAMPVTGSNKVAKASLREQAWETGDPVWWRPERRPPYRPMTATDRAALAEAFRRNGRAHLLELVAQASSSSSTNATTSAS